MLFLRNLRLDCSQINPSEFFINLLLNVWVNAVAIKLDNSMVWYPLIASYWWERGF